MNECSVESKKFINLPIVFIVACWIVYAFLYVILKSSETTKIFAGYLELIIMVVTDIAAFIGSVYICKIAIAQTKRIFVFFALAFGFVIIDDAIYNFIFYVLKMPHSELSNLVLSSYNIPYLLFLIFQVLFFISIFVYAKFSKIKANMGLLIPVVATGIILLFVFFFSINWKEGQLSLGGFYNVSDDVLGAVRFVVAALCLAVSRNRGLTYLFFGTLLAGIVNIILDFGFFTQDYHTGSVLETLLALSSVFQVYGLFYLIKTKSYLLQPQQLIFEPDSIRTQCAFWGFLICVMSLSVFLGVSIFLQQGSLFF